MTNGWLERRVHPNGSAMFDRLEEIVDDYNKNNADKGGKCYLQRVNGNGPDKQDLILSICTPLMSRVHETMQAGEMAFMESSGALIGTTTLSSLCALIIRVEHYLFESGEHQANHSCLEKFKFILSSHAFGGKGSQKGPDIFMIDDATGQRQALRVHWQQATLLLCIFHFLQATWRWLLDSKHSILKDDR